MDEKKITPNDDDNISQTRTQDLQKLMSKFLETKFLDIEFSSFVICRSPSFICYENNRKRITKQVGMTV